METVFILFPLQGNLVRPLGLTNSKDWSQALSIAVLPQKNLAALMCAQIQAKMELEAKGMDSMWLGPHPACPSSECVSPVGLGEGGNRAGRGRPQALHRGLWDECFSLWMVAEEIAGITRGL